MLEILNLDWVDRRKDTIEVEQETTLLMIQLVKWRGGSLRYGSTTRALRYQCDKLGLAEKGTEDV